MKTKETKTIKETSQEQFLVEFEKGVQKLHIKHSSEATEAFMNETETLFNNLVSEFQNANEDFEIEYETTEEIEELLVYSYFLITPDVADEEYDDSVLQFAHYIEIDGAGFFSHHVLGKIQEEKEAEEKKESEEVEEAIDALFDSLDELNVVLPENFSNFEMDKISRDGTHFTCTCDNYEYTSAQEEKGIDVETHYLSLKLRVKDHSYSDGAGSAYGFGAPDVEYTYTDEDIQSIIDCEYSYEMSRIPNIQCEMESDLEDAFAEELRKYES